MWKLPKIQSRWHGEGRMCSHLHQHYEAHLYLVPVSRSTPSHDAFQMRWPRGPGTHLKYLCYIKRETKKKGWYIVAWVPGADLVRMSTHLSPNLRDRATHVQVKRSRILGFIFSAAVHWCTSHYLLHMETFIWCHRLAQLPCMNPMPFP